MAEQLKYPSPATPRKSSQRNSSARRRQVIAVLMLLFGVLILLSIVSYSYEDEAILEKISAFDILRLPFNETVKAEAAQIKNHLGLLGALCSNFFINMTVGYVSFMFPVLMLMWAWIILRKKRIEKPVVFTNYAVVLMLLVSAGFGIANSIFGDIDKEWSGIMGAFMAELMTGLLGVAGSSIVVLTLLFITVVLAIDLDIHKSLERVEAMWEALRTWYAERRAERAEEEPEESEVVIRQVEEEEQEEPARIHALKELPTIVEETEVEEPPADIPLEIVEGLPQEEHEVPEPPKQHKRDVRDASEQDEEIDYVFPSVDLLDAARQSDTVDNEELKANAELLRAKLANFGVAIDSVSVTPGPVITLYELVPAEGVKISRIVSLADDLALALAARGIRIIAPIPGKSAVGVEIPNKNPSIVYLRSVVNSSKFREAKALLPIAFGKTISGDVYTDDLSKLPHLLIAGSTGSGKSVGINTILAGFLFRLHPSDVKFIIIDPKKIELALYARLKHHFLAVSPDIDEEIITTPAGAVSVLKSVELEMEKRYDRLASAGVRNIQDYNERLQSGRLKNTETIIHRKMPFLVVVIDELADLMLTAAREVEEPIARLAQLARAVGIHLVLATQRPSVDVITGVIKANFPARVAYQVASKTDSRTILDMNGAEQLLGSGDMLYLPSGSPKPFRIQNAFISSDEVERLTDHIAHQQGYSKPWMLPSIMERKSSGPGGTSGDRDEFFEEAARLIVRHQQGSVSLIQRRLKVGYSRAARIVDELEAAGIVGPFDGSKARQVLIETEDELNQVLRSI